MPLVYRLPSNSHSTPCSKVEALGVKPDFRLPNLSKLRVYQNDSTRCCRGVYDTVCRVLQSKVLLYVSAHGKQLSSASHVPLEVTSVLQALKGRCGVISRSWASKVLNSRILCFDDLISCATYPNPSANSKHAKQCPTVANPRLGPNNWSGRVVSDLLHLHQLFVMVAAWRVVYFLV